VESIGTFHDASIMHLPTTLRIPYLPVELKRNSLLKNSFARPSAPGSRAEYAVFVVF
jgi:hypothetical protein